METLVKFEDIEKNKWYWAEYGGMEIVRVIEVFDKSRILVNWWGEYNKPEYLSSDAMTATLSHDAFLKAIDDPRPALPEPWHIRAKCWIEEFKKIWE